MKKNTILVIDDSEIDVLLLGTLFAKITDYKLMHITDPEKAIETISKNINSILAIILDVNMPKISGVKLLKLFKENKIDIPVIVLTGSSPDIYITEECFKEGAVDILEKPRTVEEMTIITNRMQTFIKESSQHERKKILAERLKTFRESLPKISE